MYGRGQQQVRFGPPVTPDIIKYLLIANVGAFLLEILALRAGMFWVWNLSVIPAQFWEKGYFWQPFTYMWMHSPSGLMHIAFNMLALWMFGSSLASAWGERRFLRFYLGCGIGAGFVIAAVPALLYSIGLDWGAYGVPTLGASGAVFGVLLAYSLTWPDRTIMLLFPPVPIKAIWFIPFILAIELLFPGGGNISHVGHLGGVAVGWLLFRRMAGDSIVPSLGPLKYRWRRWRMRRRLRAVRTQDQQRSRRGSDDDWTIH